MNNLHADDPIPNHAYGAKWSLGVSRGNSTDGRLQTIPRIEWQKLVVLQQGLLELSERYAGFHMDRQVRRIVFGNSRKPRDVNGAVGAPEWISEIRLGLGPNRNDRTLFRRERVCQLFYGFRPQDP